MSDDLPPLRIRFEEKTPNIRSTRSRPNLVESPTVVESTRRTSRRPALRGQSPTRQESPLRSLRVQSPTRTRQVSSQPREAIEAKEAREIRVLPGKLSSQRRKRTATKRVIPEDVEELPPLLEKVPIVEEKETGPLKFSQLPEVIIAKIASNLTPIERSQLALAASFINSYLAAVPVELYDRPIIMSDFKDYFNPEKFPIEPRIKELNIIVNIETDDLSPLTPYIGSIEKLEISYGHKIRRIDASVAKTVDISILANATMLKELTLTLSYNFADLNVLNSCSNLTSLTLRNYQGNETNLSGCENLTTISIQGIRVYELLASISQLQNLEKIEIFNVEDLDRIPNFTKCLSLRSLSLKSCLNLTNVAGLENCEQINRLFIRNADIRSFDVLSTCLGLKEVFIIKDKHDREDEYILIDTDIFAKLPALNFMRLDGVKFTADSSFEHFHSLTELALENLWNENIPKLPIIKESSPGLKKLILFNLAVTELKELENSNNLEYISIMDCINLRSANFISGCPNLTKIGLTNISLDNYNFFIGHDLVEELVINNIQEINSLTFLRNYPRLKRLQLVQTAITNLEGIENHLLLENLYIKNNVFLTNFSGIETLLRLNELVVIKCPVIVCPRLNGSEELKTVIFEDTQIANIDFLTDCKNVEVLVLIACLNLQRINAVSTLDKLRGITLDKSNNIVSLEPLISCPSFKSFIMKQIVIGVGKKKLSLLPLANCRYLRKVNIEGSTGIKDVEEFMRTAPEFVEAITLPNYERYKLIGNEWKLDK
jgi:hypothetical protein